MDRSEQLWQSFEAFHRANPQIWALFERFTLECIDSGFEHYSSKTIFERIRWHVDVETKGSGSLKLNNNFTCFYARLFHAAYPEDAGFFRNRRRESEGAPAFDEHLDEHVAPPERDEARFRDRLLALLRASA